MNIKSISFVFLALFLIAGCWSASSPPEELFKAIKDKKTEVVQSILASGKINLDPPREPNTVNKPLAYAAAYGNLEIVKIFIQKGADINGQVAYGDAPLIKATEHKNRDIIKYLLEQGADVNLPNVFGVTPFMGWCGMGDIELVNLGLKNGGKVNESYMQITGQAKGKKNWTALQASAAYGQLEVVKILLTYGGDLTIKDSYGHSSLDLANDRGHEETANFIKNFQPGAVADHQDGAVLAK